MFKHQDSYLNELQQRANKLLRVSSSNSQSSFHNKNTLDLYEPKSKSHLRPKTTNRRNTPSKLSDSHSSSQSQTVPQISYNQTKHIPYKPQPKSKAKQISNNDKQITNLKQYIKELQQQNKILKTNRNNQASRLKSHNKSVEEQMKKFKKQMKSKLQQKFSLQVQVWIKKLKKVEKEKMKKQEEYIKQLQDRDRQIERIIDEKKHLKKKINKLNKFILKQVPGISAEVKANSLLIQSCINKYYPK